MAALQDVSWTLPDIPRLPDRPSKSEHGAANSAPLEALLGLVRTNFSTPEPSLHLQLFTAPCSCQFFNSTPVSRPFGWCFRCHLQVATGHILLAELYRISKELPQPLRLGALMEGRYAAILFDYRYFKDRTALEQKIEASAELQLLDDQFREVKSS